jgi:hypothetical protein
MHGVARQPHAIRVADIKRHLAAAPTIDRFELRPLEKAAHGLFRAWIKARDLRPVYFTFLVRPRMLGKGFFEDFKDERTALDPADWIENSAFDFEASEFRSFDFRNEDLEPDQARIEAATTQ